jgi:transcriptional regulator with PAS, ATPase and Fis domain
VDLKPETTPQLAAEEHLHLRLIIIIPVIFILVSLSVGLVAMGLTQSVFRPPQPSSKDLLLLRLGIVGSSLFAGLLGALLAHGITKPVRRAILEAEKMIRYAKADAVPIKATNEVGALSALFDQAFVSFIEVVQAREMLDGINEGIMALDKEGQIAGMNLRAQETLELSLAEARQQNLKDLLAYSPTNSLLVGIAERVLAEQQERGHNGVPFHSRSGKDRFLSVKASPLRLRREPREFIGVIITFNEYAARARQFPEIIGQSEPFTEVLALVAKVAPADSTALLMGESGTGKEIIADAIHRLSRRKEKPLIKLNCAAIPEGLLESELFGHEKGAFTGATARKPGKFELANGGTVFLDEIGDMSPSTQAKLLRVLQEKEVTPLGSGQVKQVDVRIIAATNKDLLQEVRAGRFREDLFHRLNVMTIIIPPLRERKSDIPFLADYFLTVSAEKSQTGKKSLSRGATDALLNYSWPGNVRELENAIERACLLNEGSIIQAENLPLAVMPPKQAANGGANGAGVKADRVEIKASLNETLDAVEKELIIQALKRSNGVQVEAAKLLGLNHKNLWHKIRKHKIEPAYLKQG